MTYRFRFAPSPTGFLHIGNVRMALINYMLAKSMGGEFILRIDNTDSTRSLQEYIDALKEDLQWLGLQWDDTFSQIDHLDKYNEILNQCIERGIIYPCYETPEELSLKRKLLLKQGLPPIYDRAMLNISDQQKQKYIDEGRKPHYRFKVEHKLIKWNDLCKGEVEFHGANISDPVLVRNDGSFLYILTSVVDDINSNITHIVRGEDHISNTAVQIQLFEALGAKVPNMIHLPLITQQSGGVFSKRDNSLSIRNLRAQNIMKETIVYYLFIIGLSSMPEYTLNLQDLVKQFDLSSYSNSSAIFDLQKLDQTNSHILSLYSEEQINTILKENSQDAISDKAWDLIKQNVTNIESIKQWTTILDAQYLPTVTIEKNADLINILLSSIPNKLDQNNIKTWLDEVKSASGIKNKELFLSIRQYITGTNQGPNIQPLLLYLDSDIIKKRLKALS